MADPKHFTATDKNRRGYFEKKNAIIRDYKAACREGKRGYLGKIHEAHHCLPATAFKKAIASEVAEKQAYIANCQHVTDWNINNKLNMIGLPHVRAFIVLGGAVAGLTASGGKIKAKAKSPANAGLGWMPDVLVSELSADPPYGHPVHQPVSWGHTLYNKAVESDIKTKILNTLNEQKKKHKIDPETFEAALKELEEKYYAHLMDAGKKATAKNWSQRANPKNSLWYQDFLMFPGANPFG